jgi:hypothetical protein
MATNMLFTNIRRSGNIYRIHNREPNYFKEEPLIGAYKWDNGISRKKLRMISGLGSFHRIYDRRKYLTHMMDSYYYHDTIADEIYVSQTATDSMMVYSSGGELLRVFGKPGIYANCNTPNNFDQITDHTLDRGIELRLTSSQYLNVYHNNKTGYTYRIYRPALDSNQISFLEDGSIDYYASFIKKPHCLQIFDTNGEVLYDNCMTGYFIPIKQLGDVLLVDGGYKRWVNEEQMNIIYKYRVLSK